MNALETTRQTEKERIDDGERHENNQRFGFKHFKKTLKLGRFCSVVHLSGSPCKPFSGLSDDSASKK